MDDRQIKQQLAGFWQTTALPVVRKYGFIIAVAVVFFVFGALVGCSAQAAEPECRNYVINNATGKKTCFESAPAIVVERVYERATERTTERATGAGASTIYNPRVDLPSSQGPISGPKAYDRSAYERGITYTVNTDPRLGIQTRTPTGSATGRPTEVFQYRR